MREKSSDGMAIEAAVVQRNRASLNRARGEAQIGDAAAALAHKHEVGGGDAAQGPGGDADAGFALKVLVVEQAL